MKKIFFNHIICSIENKYTKNENDKIVIDFLDEGYEFIRNNKDIRCDKVEILNGIGILFYYKGVLVHHIEEIFLEINFDDSYNTICIKNSQTQKTILYLYYNNQYMPNDLDKDKLSFTNIKYKVGDIVYPKNVSYYHEGEKETNSIGSLVFLRFARQIDMFNKGESPQMDEEQFEEFCKAMEFEIIEIVGNQFYKIKMKKVDESMEEVLSSIYYSTDKDLMTLEELKENAVQMKESIRKFREQ